MSDAFAGVVGHDEVVGRLRAAVAQPVHAYLFVGPAGVGKASAALAFAAGLLCADGGCGSCRSCRLALAAEHPDVMVVRRVGPYITADQAREVVRLAARSPVEGARKVIVLTDFHLVAQAGPILLKSIEEPGPSTVYVVVADDVPPELVTIASRCVPIEFGLVAPDVVRAALVASGVSPDVASLAAEAAGGNLTRARLLAADPDLAVRREAWRAVPDRLDGTGAVVAQLVDHLLGLVETASGPLAQRQATELATAQADAERYGTSVPTKTLDAQHKRELRRLRTDELRFGLAQLAGAYRDRLASAVHPRPLVDAVGAIHAAADALIRNPNEVLLLQGLLISLPRA